MAVELFGFQIRRKEEEENKNLKSFVDKDDLDGAMNVISTSPTGAIYGGMFVDLEGSAKNEAELITRYRSMEQQPEVARAVDDIVNEAIVINDENRVVEIVLDDIDLSDNIKKRVTQEFETVLSLLDFSNKAYNIFHRFYVDGRLKYHVIIDPARPKEGIKELRYIDPRKIRKVREMENKKDPKTGIIIKNIKEEYYIYNDRGFNYQANTSAGVSDSSLKGVKISKDSIIDVNSGFLNDNNTLVLSYLHIAIKPLNQLKMLEDAAVIYRLSRAPERRIFYIDVGNLPKMKAEQYLRDMMVKHKNRLVYDSATGEVRDDRKHMTMLEDFWLPRREGGRGTEITTLPGGQNLAQIDDIVYFQKNLYKSLNVPTSRMESDGGFSLGRDTEISRDEIKFGKFVKRLRARFSNLFDSALEKQLVLTNVMTPEEFKLIKNKIRYNFQQDSHFEELKNSEILKDRIANLDAITNYIGTFFSKTWVRKNILKMSDQDIELMEQEIFEENQIAIEQQNQLAAAQPNGPPSDSNSQQ
jgi:hypothetical protein